LVKKSRPRAAFLFSASPAEQVLGASRAIPGEADRSVYTDA